jgi:23S rRNA (uracil1939-C5)-methyltransferase
MGLAKEVNQAILQYTPEIVVYLSCNPITQAMDFAKLKEKYSVIYSQGYNFFPHTPHIEHLLILKKKV